jgi:hypothetical protein
MGYRINLLDRLGLTTMDPTRPNITRRMSLLDTPEMFESFIIFFLFFSLMWVSGQLARTSTNPTGPEVNDHISLQWPSYEQPQGSNLRPQREQTSWSQVLITGPPPRWLFESFIWFYKFWLLPRFIIFFLFNCLQKEWYAISDSLIFVWFEQNRA